MAKMSKAKQKAAARKAWRTRKAKYGKDGLTPRGLNKVKAAARKGKRRRKK